MLTNVFEKHDVVDAASAARTAGAVDAARTAGAAGRGDCAVGQPARSDIAPVSLGGGSVDFAELQLLPPESGRAVGSFRPGWSQRNPDGIAAVESTRACRRASGRVVSERREATASKRVEDSGVKGRASACGPDGKDSSVDGGSRNVGIGQQFAEPKPIAIPPKVYRIGEIVEHSSLSRQTIHNYTTMGLLMEARRSAGGHRLYDESVFERLNGIMALKAQHKSLAYIREYYAKLDAG